MLIAIASGKGGTGKTTVAVSLALACHDQVKLIDCDVEEPNSHLFLKTDPVSVESVSVKIPRVDEKKCTHCGICADFCQFNALAVTPQKVLVFDALCHACGGCALFCPAQAIQEEEREIGKIEISRKDNLTLISGVLNVGEAKPVPLISAVKQKQSGDATVILDVSPGTSCSMTEAVKDVDFCILVSESTPFSLSDLKLALGAVKKMKIKSGVVINKYNRKTDLIEDFCQKEGVPVLLKIPEKREIAVSYAKGMPLIEAYPEYRQEFERLLKGVLL